MAETILIVDADPVQRRPIENTVRRFGYAPLVAAGGAAALELELATDAPRVDGIIRLQIGRSTLYRRL